MIVYTDVSLSLVMPHPLSYQSAKDCVVELCVKRWCEYRLWFILPIPNRCPLNEAHDPSSRPINNFKKRLDVLL